MIESWTRSWRRLRPRNSAARPGVRARSVSAVCAAGKTGTTTGGDAATASGGGAGGSLRPQSPDVVWVNACGGGQEREAIAEHDEEVAQPSIDAPLSHGGRVQTVPFAMPPAGELRKLRVQSDRPLATQTAGRVLRRGWERSRYTSCARRRLGTAAWCVMCLWAACNWWSEAPSNASC